MPAKKRPDPKRVRLAERADRAAALAERCELRLLRAARAWDKARKARARTARALTHYDVADWQAKAAAKETRAASAGGTTDAV